MIGESSNWDPCYNSILTGWICMTASVPWVFQKLRWQRHPILTVTDTNLHELHSLKNSWAPSLSIWQRNLPQLTRGSASTAGYCKSIYWSNDKGFQSNNEVVEATTDSNVNGQSIQNVAFIYNSYAQAARSDYTIISCYRRKHMLWKIIASRHHSPGMLKKIRTIDTQEGA